MIGRRTFSGGVLALSTTPFAARAQAPQRVPRIALFATAGNASSLSETGPSATWRAFFIELKRLGYVEGRSITINRWSDEGNPSRRTAIAREIVESQPDVVVVDGTQVSDIQAVNKSIPIVGSVADPLGYGFSGSMARPDKNFTGVTPDTGPEIYGKRMEILHEAVPNAKRVGFLTLPLVWNQSPNVKSAVAAAAQLNFNVIPTLAAEPVDAASYARAFMQAAEEKLDAVYVHSGPSQNAFGQTIAALSLATRIPIISPYSATTRAGGLISYGPDSTQNYILIARYVDRILKGARVSELPIQQPTVFEFVVNLRTAKTLNLKLSDEIMIRATEVIE